MEISLPTKVVSRRGRRLQVPAKAHPLVKQLYTEMISREMRLSDMEEKSGVKGATICSWRMSRNPSLENLAACFNAIGMKFEVTAFSDA